MKKKTDRKAGATLSNFYIAVIFIFLYIPIFSVILFSFNTSKLNIVFEGFTLQW